MLGNEHPNYSMAVSNPTLHGFKRGETPNKHWSRICV